MGLLIQYPKGAELSVHIKYGYQMIFRDDSCKAMVVSILSDLAEHQAEIGLIRGDKEMTTPWVEIPTGHLVILGSFCRSTVVQKVNELEADGWLTRSTEDSTTRKYLLNIPKLQDALNGYPGSGVFFPDVEPKIQPGHKDTPHVQ